MTTVEFDDAGGTITSALTDEVEREFVGRRDNLVFQTIQEAHRRLRQAADEKDYRVEDVIGSLEVVETRRDDGQLEVRFGWGHRAAEFFEFGTSAHTIQGDPVLSFVWETRHDPPQWVREEFDQARGEGGQFASGWRVFFGEVEVDGVDEIRWVRGALDWLEREAERL